jgi:hypothetical protein
MIGDTLSPRRSVHHLVAIAAAMSLAALLATAAPSEAGGPHGGRSHSGGSSRRSSEYTGPRDSRGRIARSESAKEAFMRQTGYPHGRPGYVVDHIVPLASGGADDPSNMQWQTVEEAKAKDKWERK